MRRGHPPTTGQCSLGRRRCRHNRRPLLRRPPGSALLAAIRLPLAGGAGIITGSHASSVGGRSPPERLRDQQERMGSARVRGARAVHAALAGRHDQPPGQRAKAALLLRKYLAASGVQSTLLGELPERQNLVARLRHAPRSYSLAHGPTDVVRRTPQSGRCRPSRERSRATSSGAAAPPT